MYANQSTNMDVSMIPLQTFGRRNLDPQSWKFASRSTLYSPFPSAVHFLKKRKSQDVALCVSAYIQRCNIKHRGTRYLRKHSIACKRWLRFVRSEYRLWSGVQHCLLGYSQSFSDSQSRKTTYQTMSFLTTDVFPRFQDE